jgi:hypothetical protein
MRDAAPAFALTAEERRSQDSLSYDSIIVRDDAAHRLRASVHQKSLVMGAHPGYRAANIQLSNYQTQ